MVTKCCMNSKPMLVETCKRTTRTQKKQAITQFSLFDFVETKQNRSQAGKKLDKNEYVLVRDKKGRLSSYRTSLFFSLFLPLGYDMYPSAIFERTSLVFVVESNTKPGSVSVLECLSNEQRLILRRMFSMYFLCNYPTFSVFSCT